jgi:type IV pilus assembly protein PilB
MLRQAPNIIMLGEIRDMETATIAINASLTGHLVFQTLHTNDAPSAVTRLIDIGVAPFLVASSARALIAQRLVRKICKRCGANPTFPEKPSCGLSGSTPTRLKGASSRRARAAAIATRPATAGGWGYFEMFVIDDEARKLIYDKVSSSMLRIGRGKWGCAPCAKTGRARCWPG